MWTLTKNLRLIGRGFPPIHSRTPPSEHLAAPTIICPKCQSRPVLNELRAMTNGSCYPCWMGEGPPVQRDPVPAEKPNRTRSRKR
jgi:hypothetical protein